MINRRRLLGSALLVGAGIRGAPGPRSLAEPRKPRRQRAQYVGYHPQPLAPPFGVFNIFVNTNSADLRRLRRARQPVRIATPYPHELIVIEPIDNNPRNRFNLRGYLYRQGPYAAYVPIRGKPVAEVTVDVLLLENQGDNTYHHYVGHGGPGRWIPQERKR